MDSFSDQFDGERKLLEFEGLVGERLPDDYRNFILMNRKLQYPAILNFVDSDGREDTIVVRRVFGIDDPCERAVLNNYKFYVTSGRIDRRYVPIAEDVGGNVLCIGISGDLRGGLFFWNHENEGLGFKRDLAQVCRSFSELIAASSGDN